MFGVTVLREKLYRFMNGRYGVDSLGYFLMWFTIAEILVNLFIESRLLNALSFFLIIYSYFRMLSRNIAARKRENAFFLSMTAGAGRWIKRKRAFLLLKRRYRVYKCSGCGQRVKIPKGKGKIEITCPKCMHKFIRRS